MAGIAQCSGICGVRGGAGVQGGPAVLGPALHSNLAWEASTTWLQLEEVATEPQDKVEFFRFIGEVDK